MHIIIFSPSSTKPQALNIVLSKAIIIIVMKLRKCKNNDCNWLAVCERVLKRDRDSCIGVLNSAINLNAFVLKSRPGHFHGMHNTC